MTDAVIRHFEERDRDAVVKLWQDCGLTRPWNDPQKDIDRKLAVNPEWFVVAEVETEVVASVMIGYDGHRGWVNYLAVKPATQRSGLGAILMAFAETTLRDAGCPKLNIQVRRSNREVLDFYRALEYDDDDCVSLGKRLISD